MTSSARRWVLICALVVAFPTGLLPAAVTVSQPYRGVTRIVRTETVPRPENMNIIEIDLTDPGIHFKLSPGNPPTPNTYSNETSTQTTLAYLNQEGAQLAVNVHFFDFPANSNGGTNLTGIVASLGNVYSAFDPSPVLSYAIVPNSPALNIDAGNHAAIVQRGATAISLASGTPYNTLSGSAQIITNGVKTIPNVPTKPGTSPPLHWYTDQIAARTAIGLSQDRNTLFLFTVDAADGSQGMSVDEMADVLLTQYGVYDALNLDGGGSTTLAMEDPVTHVGSVVNAASGGPRAVGSSLAVFAATAAPLPHYDHIVIVVEENHSYNQITGTYAASAPYINQTLIADGASFTRSYGEEHHSEGNYLWLFAGSDYNITFDDPCPVGPFSASNLGADLISAGYTFKGYSENLPSIGSTVCASGNYARKHNAWVNFSNVPNGTTVATSSNLRMTDFPSDYTTLPTVAIVVPNQANDMHDGSDPSRIAAADSWLRTNIDAYYQWAKTHNSLLIVTWDEDSGGTAGRTTPPDNQIPTVFAGAWISHGLYAEGNGINHVNVLRTIEDGYRLPHIGAQYSQALSAGLNNDAVTDVFVVPAPLISLNKTSLSPTACTGNPPLDDTFTVANGGGGTLIYTITDDCGDPDWLSVSPTGGMSTGPADTITVTYSTASLPPGQYPVTITVSATGVANTPQTIPVILTINTAKGDVNCDGLVNNGDIDPFVLALTDSSGYSELYPQCIISNADINDDGLVNNGDIDPFVALLTGG